MTLSVSFIYSGKTQFKNVITLWLGSRGEGAEPQQTAEAAVCWNMSIYRTVGLKQWRCSQFCSVSRGNQEKENHILKVFSLTTVWRERGEFSPSISMKRPPGSLCQTSSRSHLEVLLNHLRSADSQACSGCWMSVQFQHTLAGIQHPPKQSTDLAISLRLLLKRMCPGGRRCLLPCVSQGLEKENRLLLVSSGNTSN